MTPKSNATELKKVTFPIYHKLSKNKQKFVILVDPPPDSGWIWEPLTGRVEGSRQKISGKKSVKLGGGGSAKFGVWTSKRGHFGVN